jgi:hypothetical protein
MNTLSAMSEGTEVPPEDAQKVPILFSLARKAVLLLLAILVVTYIIVAFCVAEAKALWPRGRMSHTK